MICSHEPRFPSPNSPLPPDELERLKASIDTANELLRTLGNPPDPKNAAALRQKFRSLRGRLIRVVTECGGEQVEVTGSLMDAGKDYVQLDALGPISFILFARICAVVRSLTAESKSMGEHGQELADIDPELRRALVLRFGEVVSGNPELVQIFFGLRLHQRLVSFLGCPVRIRRAGGGEEAVLEGILAAVQEERVEVQAGKQLHLIQFGNICLIEVTPASQAD